MKVLHLITGLEVGGAEMMLLNLLRQPSFTRETSRVISLTSLGAIGPRILDLGIDVIALGMEPGKPQTRGLKLLIRLIREDPPDLIQSWMYHADLLGAMATLGCGNIPIIWGIHHTLDGEVPVQKSTMRVIKLNALLSRWIPRKIVCCAESARTAHLRAGYYPSKLNVIPNGIDINEFSPDPVAYEALRTELGLDRSTPLIGLFARFHPQKDHRTFIQAAGILRKAIPEVHYVLAGTGVLPENHELMNWIHEAAVQNNTHLLGLRLDMPGLLSAVDIAGLSSAFGEALPLSVAEAMACGVPCVVTDIGDSALLVGNTGKTVPPRSPEALAKAWLEILTLSKESKTALGRQARAKIALEYNIQRATERYLSLYQSIVVSGDNHGK